MHITTSLDFDEPHCRKITAVHERQHARDLFDVRSGEKEWKSHAL